MRAFSISVCLLLAAAAVPAQAPRRAPGFSLPDANSQQKDLADYRGKVVIVDFMKTDCEHCGAFSQILEQVNTRYRGRVVVLSIAPAPDSPVTISQFRAKFGVTYPILFDCGQVAFSYIRPNPLNPAIALPRFFIVGPDGYILKDFEFGPQTQEIFRGQGLFSELDRILARLGKGEKL
jgi:peroxiredoxin